MESNAQANARFWTFAHGSYVKVTVPIGATLHWSTCCKTDEGYSAEMETWSNDGFTLSRESGSDGRDCDGRLSSYCETRCPIADLQAGYRDENGIAFPQWELIDESQRDYAAEAAGY